jgi:hypothetical protein
MVRRQVTPIVDRRRHILDLISPVSNLTSLRDSPSTQVRSVTCSVKLFRLRHSGYLNLNILFQSEVLSSTPGIPKKLFGELEPTSTQDNMEELLGLCSGQFTGLCHQLYT